MPQFGISKFVYSDYVLLRSYLALKEKRCIAVPEGIEQLVEEVYGVPSPTGIDQTWQDRLEASQKALEEEQKKIENKGSSRVIPSPDFDSPWKATTRLLEEDDPDLHRSLQAQTRDSPPSVELVCLYDSPNGPCTDPEGKDPIDLEGKLNSEAIKKILNRAAPLSSPEVVRFFKDGITPAAWRRSAVLSRYKIAVFKKVFPLTQHSLQCGEKVLILSEELGLIIAEGVDVQI
jgi:CRISPR-associated endonuclease/helicase Cas3